METLQTEYDIVVSSVGVTRQSRVSAISSVEAFRTAVALPYINALIENIEGRFSKKERSLLVAMSIFNPAQLPYSSHDSFNSYGKKAIQVLASFYGEEVEMELFGDLPKC